MPRPHRDISVIVALLAGSVVLAQLRFLFSYPIPDTGMWFGDESWMMLIAKGMIATGAPKIPEAIGSTLSHSTGLVVGSLWFYSFLYGLPATVFSSLTDPVAIGR